MHDETDGCVENVEQVASNLDECMQGLKSASRTDAFALFFLGAALFSGLYNSFNIEQAIWPVTSSFALASVIFKQITTSTLNRVVQLQNDNNARLLATLVEKSK